MPFSTVVDFVSSLSLVLLLASAYSAIYRRITKRRTTTDVVLGALFGLVTLFQMHRPFEPVEGLIIDLRNVPIVLAGAFLGWPGLLACLGIAVATRLNVGGVGMVSGVMAMCMVAAIGRTWRSATRRRQMRSGWKYL
ncbi:MAG: LytS/YhcK type 5TM receptor domain-containing protein, partial [Pseudomonadota bacterium]